MLLILISHYVVAGEAFSLSSSSWCTSRRKRMFTADGINHRYVCNAVRHPWHGVAWRDTASDLTPALRDGYPSISKRTTRQPAPPHPAVSSLRRLLLRCSSPGPPAGSQPSQDGSRLSDFSVHLWGFVSRFKQAMGKDPRLQRRSLS